MAKKPRSPQEVFESFKQDVVADFGPQVEAIYLYGSGARGEYDRKRSDINFLVVLTEEGMDHLEKTASRLAKWSKKGLAMPLFLTHAYIDSSLDSFPIEFLNLKMAHELVYGRDFLKDLEISRASLRLKCEEQVKSKLLHLREGVLSAWNKKPQMEAFLNLTIPTFLSLFRVLILLNNSPVPQDNVSVFKSAAEIYQLDTKVFETMTALREKRIKLNNAALKTLAKSLIVQIKNLSETIDQLSN